MNIDMNIQRNSSKLIHSHKLISMYDAGQNLPYFSALSYAWNFCTSFNTFPSHRGKELEKNVMLQIFEL